MEITKVVKPFIRSGWHNTFGNIVYFELPCSSKAMFLAFVKPNFSISKIYLNYDLSLSMSNAETVIHAFMTSRLGYCNALLGG